MKKCPKCNAEYGDGATYCEACGTKLIKYIKCPKCGSEIPDDSSFCPRCGYNLNETSVSPNVSTESSAEVIDDKLIAQYKREIESYKSKRVTFAVLGGIFLGVGFILFIVFTALMSRSILDNPSSFNVDYIRYLFLMVLSELILDAGIAFLIIQGAVFAKKIANRRKAIEKAENNH